MNSTFMGLEIAKRGLSVHQQALQTSGHNISNAENEAYSRQRVVITSADPLYVPALNRANGPGNIGQGSVISSVERIRDEFVDNRIIAEKNVMGYLNARDQFIDQVEKIYNEPSDESIRGSMDRLWAAWEELSKYPEERSAREVVKERARHLAREVNHVYSQLHELRVEANRKIGLITAEVNLHARNIRDLNERILKAKALGDNPNDLMDKRDALIEKLSEIVEISVGRTDPDEIIVYLGGENLIQGEVLRPISAKSDPEYGGFYRIEWEGLGTPVTVNGGRLKGLLEVRDEILRENINDINSFALNLADLTNEIHRDGFGKNNETNINFFAYRNISDNTEGNFDINNDGIEDISAVFRVSGANSIDPDAAIGISGTMTFVMNDASETPVQVDYRATDTLRSVLKRINDAKAGIDAYVNHNSQLALKATASKDDDRKNFMIRHLEDSGQFLVGFTGILNESGAVGAFDYRRVDDVRKLMPDRESITLAPDFNPAAYMALERRIEMDVNAIAAAGGKDLGGTGDFNQSNGIGDGSNALRMAAVRHGHSMIAANSTFNEFYISLVSRIGAQGEEVKERMASQDTLLGNLKNLRESISGVSLDEEMANMVAFQHGYNASARVISTIDRMLDVIINRMGV